MIKELKTNGEFSQAYPVMSQLRKHLSIEEYLTLLDNMLKEGYRLFALYDEDEQVKALAGIIQSTNFYNGNHLYVYDLVTDSSERSKGYGEALLLYIEKLAEELDCGIVELSSGVQRLGAHRFYEEKMNYDRVSYVFRKKIEKRD